MKSKIRRIKNDVAQRGAASISKTVTIPMTSAKDQALGFALLRRQELAQQSRERNPQEMKPLGGYRVPALLVDLIKQDKHLYAAMTCAKIGATRDWGYAMPASSICGREVQAVLDAVAILMDPKIEDYDLMTSTQKHAYRFFAYAIKNSGSASPVPTGDDEFLALAALRSIKVLIFG